MPTLRSLIIGDTAAAWTAAGFTVKDNNGRASTGIGDIEIELVGAEGGRGIVGWRFDETQLPPDINSIDGVQTLRGGTEPAPALDHPNTVSHLDHVVMFTPDLQRTVAALTSSGFETRRTRNVPGTEPLRQQVFLWAGSTIIELVGPAEPTGDDPASLWGLAVTCDDLDAAHASLAGGLGTPKPAVQTGRRIATLRTRDLDISTAIAFMTPHEAGSTGA